VIQRNALRLNLNIIILNSSDVKTLAMVIWYKTTFNIKIIVNLFTFPI